MKPKKDSKGAAGDCATTERRQALEDGCTAARETQRTQLSGTKRSKAGSQPTKHQRERKRKQVSKPEISDTAIATSKAGNGLLKTLLGNFQGFFIAHHVAEICSDTPRTLPKLFKSHCMKVYPDRQIDSLNPGWEPTMHIFELHPKLMNKLNLRLAEMALDLEANTDGLKVSNLGGFHSDQFLFDTPGDKAIALLRDVATAAVRCAEKEEFGRPAAKEAARPTHSWVNVSRHGNCNGLHDHCGASWSGCYYVRCPCSSSRSTDSPGSGDFIFRTAVGGLTHSTLAKVMGAGLEGAKSASKAISGIRLAQDGAEPEGWCRYGIVEPEEGMLILFPSWLPHCVMPFVAPEEDPGAARISIAFNVGMQQDGVR